MLPANWNIKPATMKSVCRQKQLIYQYHYKVWLLHLILLRQIELP